MSWYLPYLGTLVQVFRWYYGWMLTGYLPFFLWILIGSGFETSFCFVKGWDDILRCRIHISLKKLSFLNQINILDFLDSLLLLLIIIIILLMQVYWWYLFLASAISMCLKRLTHITNGLSWLFGLYHWCRGYNGWELNSINLLLPAYYVFTICNS